ncbi:cytochrome c3 family protein [Planctomycetota bacterium]
MSERQRSESPPKRRRFRAFILRSLCALIVAAVCLLGVSAAMGPLSTAGFCVSCHEMSDAHASWQESPHHTNASGVQVTCVSCHLPPREHYAAHMWAKAAAGITDAYVHFFGEYDADEARRSVRTTLPSGRCLHCHSNLCGKPSSTAVGAVHAAVVAQPSGGTYGCVMCHQGLHGPKGEPPWKEPRDPTDNFFCYVCHLNFNGEEFVAVHEAAGVGCVGCHGESLDHADDEDHTTSPDIMYTRAAVNGSCATADCHAKAEMERVVSHGPFFAGTDTAREHCTDCHGNHRIENRHRKWDKTTGELIWRDGYTVDRAGGM